MKAWKAMVLLSYISTASISAALLTPALPEIAHFYVISQSSVMAVVSWFLFGYVMGQLIYGPLANRWGSLRALRVGLFVNLAGIALAGLSILWHSFTLLVVARVVMALGTAAGLSCGMMLIHDYCDKSQAPRVLAYAIISFTVGIGLAVSVGGFVTQYVSWAVLLLVLLAHGIVMLLLTLLFKPLLHKAQAISLKTITRNYAAALKSPRLIVFSLVVGLCSLVSYCYSAAAPLIAEQQLHLTAAAYGSWNAINMLGMLASGILARVFMHRVSAQRMITLGIAGSLLVAALLALLQWQGALTAVTFFISTALLYLFAGLLFPAGSWLALENAADRASASSMMSFINMSSAFFAVVLMAYLPGGVFMQLIGMLSISCVLVAACLLLKKMLRLQVTNISVS
ncbi:MAG: MFS transporter [Coxiellaceae bacterium]|nr:MFS transporter [Coxiellaceae bacterium]